mmetsp:Transcript_58585/g.186775  ORF Transcript_58585/g.186775 Transcript_58585/m.186775 type:complete len:140 (+) Transcript_58585:97-516(+)
MQPPGGVREWLGQGAGEVEETGLMDPLEHVARRQYHVPCNWKVFADNYLDGGYHVPFAHGALSDALDMSTYRSELFEKVSVQRCGPAAVGEGEAAGERLGGTSRLACLLRAARAIAPSPGRGVAGALSFLGSRVRARED